jgi:hypothetical protein
MARNSNTVKTDTARAYRTKYGMDMPTLTLAKIMQPENPILFKTVEAARKTLRYIEGKAGERDRRSLGKEAGEFKMDGERSKTPYAIPIPAEEDLLPYVLPKGFNNFILAGDFHIPNHRVPPIEAMFRYADENKINKLFINGDLLDNTPFTRWMHAPINLDKVKEWFDMAENFLRMCKTRFPEIYWLEGNHDFWFKRWLMSQAEKLYKDPYFHLEERLHLNDVGVTFIDQRYLVKAGHLNICHGHIIFRGGGSYANAARMLYMKTKANVIASHVHVESSHTEPDLNDKVTTTWTTGCMCSLRPEYQPYGGRSCHGFAHIRVKRNGDFVVNNYRIQNGKIL